MDGKVEGPFSVFVCLSVCVSVCEMEFVCARLVSLEEAFCLH